MYLGEIFLVMSFKRDGGDLSCVKKIKRQRIPELLGTYIPEDEAKLVSNGRLVCTICHHHPVFDTVPLLSKHRKEKVHLLELSRHLNKLRKQEFIYEPVKKQQLDALTVLDNQMSVLSISWTLPGKEHHTEFKFPKTQDRAIFNPADPTFSFSEPKPSPKQSSASEVYRYLSTLHRKRSFKSLVEWKKDNYEEQKITEQNMTLTETKDSSINVEPLKEIVINEQHLYHRRQNSPKIYPTKREQQLHSAISASCQISVVKRQMETG